MLATRTAAEGLYQFTFGSYLAPALAGVYNRVTATWEVEARGSANGCNPAPEVGFPCAEKALTLQLQPPPPRLNCDAGWFGSKFQTRLSVPVLLQHCYATTWDGYRAHARKSISGWEKDFHATGSLVMEANIPWPSGADSATDAVHFRQDDIVQSVINCLVDKAAAINRAHSPYHYLNGPNSNSAIATAFQACGLPNALPSSRLEETCGFRSNCRADQSVGYAKEPNDCGLLSGRDHRVLLW